MISGVFISGVVIVVAIYAMQALSLNLKFGTLGLIDLGVVGYFAIGAYAFTLITVPPPTALDNYSFGLGWPLWAGFLLAPIVTGAFSLVVGLPALRLHGDYLAIATYAFAEVVRAVFTNQTGLANGVVGFNNLRQPWRGHFASGVAYQFFFMGLVLLVLLLLCLALVRLNRGPFGRSLRAIRENEPVALSVGKNVTRMKIKTFVLGGMIAGLGACFYVTFQTLIVPGMFVPEITWTVWIALTIGGTGNYWGAIIGTAVLVSAQEATRLIQVSESMASAISASRLLIMGLILILIIRFRPRGILPERAWIDRSPVPSGAQFLEAGASTTLAAEVTMAQVPADDTIVR
jgi:branched-chain amino acid transport system permease protein